MKKSNFTNTAVLIGGLLFCAVANAQNAPAFGKGDNTIGLGLGVGINYGYYSGGIAPAMSVYFDHGFFGEVGPGTIGIGGILAYKSGHYNYGYGGYEYKWSSTIVAARGTYHLTILKDKNNHFDPYAGIVLGVRINHYTDTYDDYYFKNNNKHYYSNESSADAVRGVFIGAKYNFTHFFGVFVEAGSDLSIITGGINFNF
ncbi:MAG: hypothetical protein ABI763_06185 [Bacteroidota bacterium]